MVLGVWLYQCNITNTEINERLANCQERLNDTKLLLKDEQKKVKNLQNYLESEQDNHHACKIELVKCEVYKEMMLGEKVDAGWKEKYVECVRNSEEQVKKIEKCWGNETNEL